MAGYWILIVSAVVLSMILSRVVKWTDGKLGEASKPQFKWPNKS